MKAEQNQRIFIKILIYLRNYFSAAILITLIYLQFSTRFSSWRTQRRRNEPGEATEEAEEEEEAAEEAENNMQFKICAAAAE